MIRLLSLKTLSEYEEGSKTFTLKDNAALSALPVLKGLQPSKTLQEYWDNSEQVPEDWEIFEKIYREELQSERAKEALSLCKVIANADKPVNLVCTCDNPVHCIRSVIGDLLMKGNEEVFIGD